MRIDARALSRPGSSDDALDDLNSDTNIDTDDRYRLIATRTPASSVLLGLLDGLAIGSPFLKPIITLFGLADDISETSIHRLA